jgi:two-component system, OmpR family, response regulator RstA
VIEAAPALEPDRNISQQERHAASLRSLGRPRYADAVSDEAGRAGSLVYIVEDDERLAALISEYLSENGFRTEIIGRGDTAIERIEASPPQLVILDLMLPGCDGLEVCKAVRGEFRGGILMLTARKGDVDEILGLELGADDYVTKPVAPRVLLARMKTLLRRLEPRGDESPPALRTIGPLSLDRRLRDVSVRGERLLLTSIEFDILWILAGAPGEVFSREQLYREILGAAYDGLDRGMDIHLSRIRRKLERAGLEGSAIRSVRGEGYLLALV